MKRPRSPPDHVAECIERTRCGRAGLAEGGWRKVAPHSGRRCQPMRITVSMEERLWRCGSHSRKPQVRGRHPTHPPGWTTQQGVGRLWMSKEASGRWFTRFPCQATGSTSRKTDASAIRVSKTRDQAAGLQRWKGGPNHKATAPAAQPHALGSKRRDQSVQGSLVGIDPF